MKLPIPTLIPIFGTVYRVQWVDHLTNDEGHEVHGFVNFDTRVMYLAKPGPDAPETCAEETYLHELLHILCHRLCEDELGKDEDRIERLAMGLHQMLTQATYEDHPPVVKPRLRLVPKLEEAA